MKPAPDIMIFVLEFLSGKGNTMNMQLEHTKHLTNKLKGGETDMKSDWDPVSKPFSYCVNVIVSGLQTALTRSFLS